MTITAEKYQEELLDCENFSISSESFIKTVQAKKGEKLLFIGEPYSPAVFPLIRAKAQVTALTQAEEIDELESGFDGIVTQFGLHQSADPLHLLTAAFALLKTNGRLVADLAEAKVLEDRGGYSYQASLADYWTLIQQAGFEAVLVQQISVNNAEEAIKQGWQDLAGANSYPITVNRFIAVK
ncbi:hypothetical protein JOC78_002550 [Bacillus ectoiniformans]|uniref:hypothetical protein n=1 Tax=Bacillus ectoiniformans TaxID=1494429 RepID=UPI001957A64F|nr:hypothetical protein [Bacillus ectoiniformans]MBM7649576.1 hypothetical protein [Bacillus ectoiniformans]